VRDEVGSAYVLFDRDGTLIKFQHYLIESDKVELADTAIQALLLLKEYGFLFGIVTNQSVIGRGMASMDTVAQVNARVTTLFAAQDIKFEFVLVCPHLPEDICGCRKPAPGLGEIAIQEHYLDPSLSFMIGDQPSDVKFGHAIGCKSVQIGGKGNDELHANHYAKDILEAAEWIASEMRKG